MSRTPSVSRYQPIAVEQHGGALDFGRELTRRSLESVLQEETAEVEKKTRRRGAARAAAQENIAASKRGRSSRRPAR